MKRSGTFFLLALFLAGMVVLPAFHRVEAHPHSHAPCGCGEPSDQPVDDTPSADDCPVCHLAASALLYATPAGLAPVSLARTDDPPSVPVFLYRSRLPMSDGPARAPPFYV